MEVSKVVDIEKAIRNSNSRFFKSMPGFVVKLITKIIRQDEINEVINNNREKSGGPFIDGVLHDWKITVKAVGEENIPDSGRFIFASNHPVGGIDALAFFSTVCRHYPGVVSPANELLKIIPNLRPMIFGLDVFGKATRERAVELNKLFDSDTQIMIFPAGEVSRRSKGVIADLTWQKSFVSKAIEHRRDIIPVFISGRNSNLFYNVARLRKFFGIKMYIETMLLPREMLKQRNSHTTLYIGKPIKYETLTDDLTHSQWAQKIKSLVYSLPDNYKTNDTAHQKSLNN
jgi:putative hemolysin